MQAGREKDEAGNRQRVRAIRITNDHIDSQADLHVVYEQAIHESRVSAKGGDGESGERLSEGEKRATKSPFQTTAGIFVNLTPLSL